MDDLLNEFLTETFESIEVVDVELVELEKDPNNKSVLDNIFRLVHTIKGTCGFLGLPRLESVAHAGENVLGKFRDGEMEVTPDAVTLILNALDRIKEILEGLEQTQEEPEGDDSAIIDELNAMAEGKSAPAKEEAPIEVAEERETRPGEVSLDELEAAFAAAPGPDDEEPADNIPAAAGRLDAFGGADTVAVLAHLFHNRIFGDDSLKAILEGADVRQSKKAMEEFFVGSLQQDKCDTDKISSGFVAFIKNGIAEDQFYNTVKHLESVLKEVGVPNSEVEFMKDIYFQCSDGILAEAKKNSKSVVKAKKKEVAKPAGGGAAKETSIANQSIRVGVDVLDNLMNMVSELVLTRNQLMQISRRAGENDFEIPLQRLSQCTTELQEGVMKTRMQPIGNAWSKLPRIIRDLQMELGKKIDLQMLGAETELDRQVLELIKDPLTHMIRNSADHGIESVADRIAAGKKETGTIRLNAFHEGGQIIIEIADDGAGIPVDKLAAKALANNLATEEEIAEMSDTQIQRFIFHAGFSTAQKVTSVSGRGVGMDVVRTNIEKIGGTIELKSTEGKGTTFFIKIPLTLAIVSALIVESGEERFAIPQISVLELVRASGDSMHKIEYINATPVLRLRDRLLPLLHLNKILGFDETAGTEAAADDTEDFIIITQVGDFTFGIVVDRVFDTEEIVVKPVAPILRDLTVFSGNTILGDGTVIMILDPNGIANEASDAMTDMSDQRGEESDETAIATVDDKEAILLFRAGGETKRAVPLSLVSRLEEFDVAQIEISEGKKMVQYRGKLMPLVMINDDYEIKSEGRQPMLVFTDDDRAMGIIVDEISDIKEDSINVELSSSTVGQLGTAIIDGDATEVIDIAYYFEQTFNDWQMGLEYSPTEIKAKRKNILIIDDSAFFLNLLKPLLSSSGFNVTIANSAAEALELRDEGYEFDLIVSDIDMPEMDGFEFAEDVRSNGIWKETPMIALSANSSEKRFAKGREAGFDNYIEKLDRETLIKAIEEQISDKDTAA
ncbi:chemotaxis protein CheW [Pseudemcibacter aquimaris]|uniref:chemotaxis protein CheW n=1 Tax=Pseudemcibacter aquimaris TaxID=2857064 RepID=UPI002012CB13|nr:chemotaxis protein CheW [Pseudemcibacter aquimaris]MCC3862208.1 chemotaxis protein CheW [Pseudemcibacter aquimaris]WDU58961.1 chemotaxis protein CheW [Pseudemcibacter aquimaris]